MWGREAAAGERGVGGVACGRAVVGSGAGCWRICCSSKPAKKTPAHVRGAGQRRRAQGALTHPASHEETTERWA